MNDTTPVPKPSMWKKLTAEQKSWWIRLYNAFVSTDHWPKGYDGEKVKDQQFRHLIASNMATLAVFEMNGLVGKIK